MQKREEKKKVTYKPTAAVNKSKSNNASLVGALATPTVAVNKAHPHATKFSRATMIVHEWSGCWNGCDRTTL